MQNSAQTCIHCIYHQPSLFASAAKSLIVWMRQVENSITVVKAIFKQLVKEEDSSDLYRVFYTKHQKLISFQQLQKENE